MTALSIIGLASCLTWQVPVNAPSFASTPEHSAVIEFRHQTTWHNPPIPATGAMLVPGIEPGKPIVSQYRKTLALNGDEVTVISVPVDAHPLNPIREQRWSNVGDRFREAVFMKNPEAGGPASNVITEKPRPGMTPVLTHQRREFLFALGVDFAKYITTVDTSENTEAGQRLKGTMKIGGPTPIKFDLIVDTDGLVRKAELDWTVDGTGMRWEIATEGTEARGEYRLAKKGTFREVNVRKDQPVRPVDISTDLAVELIDFKVLSDKEYQDLVRLDRPPNSFLADHVAGDYSRIDGAGKVTKMFKLPERQAGSSEYGWTSWITYVVGGHALAFLLLAAGWYWLQRRRKGLT
ncbi:MAG TPA: hypothetical protein PKC45_14740 [Gemmatales bacterium]|nr:hypothetical protein [Gemmatales bacterium]